MKNEKYHDLEKDCEIKKKIFNVSKGQRQTTIQGGFCRTHKKDICRCGWEWGFHYGTKS